MFPGMKRIVVLFTLALILFFFSAALAAQAGTPARPGIALFQDDYPYPEETFFFDYPYPEETGGAVEPTDGVFLPTLTFTPEVTLTPELNLFATEDAQMGDTISSPAPSATPGPSITPAFTQTGPAQATGTPPPAAAGSGERFRVDWGYFWIGFAIPVLAACGAVLYLLDRRPELFSQRQKP
jgi:hypothetical protein